jgi:hypothetical protein
MKNARVKMWRNITMLLKEWPYHFDTAEREDGRYIISATQTGMGSTLTGAFLHALYVFCEAGECEYIISTKDNRTSLLLIIITPKK